MLKYPRFPMNKIRVQVQWLHIFVRKFRIIKIHEVLHDA